MNPFLRRKNNKGSNIPRLCRVGECEECEKEKKCDCECENCKEVRLVDLFVFVFVSVFTHYKGENSKEVRIVYLFVHKYQVYT